MINVLTGNFPTEFDQILGKKTCDWTVGYREVSKSWDGWVGWNLRKQSQQV